VVSSLNGTGLCDKTLLANFFTIEPNRPVVDAGIVRGVTRG